MSQVAAAKFRAKSLAEELFAEMGTWDSFDPCIHEVERILEKAVLLKTFEGVSIGDHYYLPELRSSARHYIEVLQRIINLINELLGDN